MANKLEVKIKRVLVGDEESLSVIIGGFTMQTVERNGFIVKTNESLCPIFFADEDLDAAREIREAKGKPIYVEARRWIDE